MTRLLAAAAGIALIVAVDLLARHHQHLRLVVALTLVAIAAIALLDHHRENTR